MDPMVPCRDSQESQGKLHIGTFSDLLNSLLIGEAKPLLDEQRVKRQSHRLHSRTSRRTELRDICPSSSFHGIREEKANHRLIGSNVQPKVTRNYAVEKGS